MLRLLRQIQKILSQQKISKRKRLRSDRGGIEINFAK